MMDPKRLQTRMYGTRGTHSNKLDGNNILFGYIGSCQDKLDPWFFSP